MFTRKLLRLAIVWMFAILISTYGVQPPVMNDCTTPTQPICGG